MNQVKVVVVVACVLLGVSGLALVSNKGSENTAKEYQVSKCRYENSLAALGDTNFTVKNCSTK